MVTENRKVYLITIFYKQLECLCIQELQNLILVETLDTELHLVKKNLLQSNKICCSHFFHKEDWPKLQHTLTYYVHYTNFRHSTTHKWLNQRQEDKQWCSGRDHHPVLQTAHFRFYGRQVRESSHPSAMDGFFHIQKTTAMFRTWTWNLRGEFNGARRRRVT
jgi:hypothetical protein